MEKIGDILQNEEKKERNLPTCPHCGKSYKWFERKINFGKGYIKVPVPDCKCMELREREAERQRILRHKTERLAKLFSNSMITPLFKEKTFDNLKQTIELHKCKEYAKLFDPKTSQGISMIGRVGTGKTTLLAAICNELMNKGYSCLFTTFSDLLDKFSEYSYEHAGNVRPLLDWLVSFDFVVLDDLGRETYTDKRKETAFRIIDAILNHKVIMAFTANPEMLAKLSKIPEWAATMDRLKETCKYKFTFEGESLRGKELNNEAYSQSGLV